MKNNDDYNAIVHGLRFDIPTEWDPTYSREEYAREQWKKYPLAWLHDEENQKWYLIELFTPFPWADSLPILIYRTKHRAWEVDDSMVLNNSNFRLQKVASNSNSTSGNVLGTCIGGGALPLIYKMFALIIPDVKISYFNGILFSLLVFIIDLFIFFLIFKLYVFFKSKFGKKTYKKLDDEINLIKSNNKQVSVKIDKLRYNKKNIFLKTSFMVFGFLMTIFCILKGGEDTISFAINGFTASTTFLVFFVFFYVIPFYPLNGTAIDATVSQIKDN